MKHLTYVAVVLATLIVVSCLRGKTEDATLFGPALAGWLSVEESYHAGLDAGTAAGDLLPNERVELEVMGDRLEAALEERDRSALRAVPWETMHPWADRGIGARQQAASIGPGVASSLREELVNLRISINRLRGSF